MARRRAWRLAVLPALLAAGGCGTSPSAPEDLVPALGEPWTDEDALPTIDGETVDYAEDFGVDPDSARYLGDTEAGEYWVALDEDGALCVLQSQKGAEAVEATCASPSQFSQHGVWVRGDTQTTSATGIVVPVGFDLDDATRDDDWVMVADNLAAPADEVG